MLDVHFLHIQQDEVDFSYVMIGSVCLPYHLPWLRGPKKWIPTVSTFSFWDKVRTRIAFTAFLTALAFEVAHKWISWFLPYRAVDCVYPFRNKAGSFLGTPQTWQCWLDSTLPSATAAVQLQPRRLGRERPRRSLLFWSLLAFWSALPLRCSTLRQSDKWQYC